MSYAQKALRQGTRRPRPDFVSLPTSLPTARDPQAMTAIRLFSELADSFMPRAERSDTQARRFVHADLADLGDEALWVEQERARFLLAWLMETDPRRAWIAERFKVLAAEEARRRRK